MSQKSFIFPASVFFPDKKINHFFQAYFYFWLRCFLEAAAETNLKCLKEYNPKKGP